MPVLTSNYKHEPFLFNSHLQTIYPAIFRKVKGINYQRERLITPDQDFLDLDWSRIGSNKLVILSHGLEGDSQRMYIKGMVRNFNKNGWDALAWNYRGCSGEMNLQPILYHSGATYDLHTVVNHVSGKYQSIVLVGFSLGGNLTLTYLGEKEHRKPEQIKAVVAFSVPLDLHSCSLCMGESQNRIYSRRFLKMLSEKVRLKEKMYPEKISSTQLKKITTIYDFDDMYTAPIHGFNNAIHYYDSCSSLNYLDSIEVPALIINAQNDSFLSDLCYPSHISNPLVNLEYPRSGGHVGFTPPGFGFPYWSEKRAFDFILSLDTIS